MSQELGQLLRDMSDAERQASALESKLDGIRPAEVANDSPRRETRFVAR